MSVKQYEEDKCCSKSFQIILNTIKTQTKNFKNCRKELIVGLANSRVNAKGYILYLFSMVSRAVSISILAKGL